MTEQDEDIISKSQRKRDAHALQKVGDTLMKLSDGQLAKIPLPENVEAAVKTGRAIKSFSARKRHMQYLGKLLRQVDEAPILEALDSILNQSDQANAHFHRLERLRDELIEKGDSAIESAIELDPELDRQHLRQLIRNAQKEKTTGKPVGASKLLFKFLRSLAAL